GPDRPASRTRSPCASSRGRDPCRRGPRTRASGSRACPRAAPGRAPASRPARVAAGRSRARLASAARASTWSGQRPCGRPSLSLPMAADMLFDPAVEAVSREELRVLQEELLRAQVARCADGSELYRAKLASAGADPQEIRTLDDLAGVPVVTKEELREDQR